MFAVDSDEQTRLNHKLAQKAREIQVKILFFVEFSGVYHRGHRDTEIQRTKRFTPSISVAKKNGCSIWEYLAVCLGEGMS